jgi:hypothetical protein
MFATDGTFRIEDVPPGEYTLQVYLTAPARPSSYELKELAHLEMDVTVPTATADAGAAPLDLGLLQLNPANLL